MMHDYKQYAKEIVEEPLPCDACKCHIGHGMIKVELTKCEDMNSFPHLPIMWSLQIQVVWSHATMDFSFIYTRSICLDMIMVIIHMWSHFQNENLISIQLKRQVSWCYSSPHS